MQSALAAPYAHVTAPLRRLVDRWGLVVCEALSAGREVPGWARDSLHELPSLMGASSQRASRLEGASVALVEAAALSGRVGERFVATVLEVRGDDAVIQLVEPVVTATCPATPAVRAGARLTGRAYVGRHVLRQFFVQQFCAAPRGIGNFRERFGPVVGSRGGFLVEFLGGRDGLFRQGQDMAGVKGLPEEFFGLIKGLLSDWLVHRGFPVLGVVVAQYIGDPMLQCNINCASQYHRLVKLSGGLR